MLFTSFVILGNVGPRFWGLGGRGLGLGLGLGIRGYVRLRGVFTTKNQIFRFLIFWRGVLLQILDKINKKLNFSTLSLLCAHLGTET